MRCLFKISLTAIVTLACAWPLAGQSTEPPRTLRRPLDALSLDGDKAARASVEIDTSGGVMVENTTLPKAVNRLAQNTTQPAADVSDRLRSMRRQPVDVDLSRSFFAAPNEPTTSHGKLPAVAKRRAGKPAPAAPPVTPEVVAEPIVTAPTREVEEEMPTPARRTPMPAPRNSVPIATRPMSTNAGMDRPVSVDATAPVFSDTGNTTDGVAGPEIDSAGLEFDAAASSNEAPATTDAAPAMDTMPAPTATVAASDDGVLLTNRAPAITFETLGPRRITIGQRANYSVRIINMGDDAAKNVLVSVKLPSWAEVNSSAASRGVPVSDSANDSESVVTWEIDQLAARGSETLNLGIIPRDSRPIDLAVGWAFAPEHSSAQIVVQEPMLKMDIHGPTEVRYGETATFAITLSNPGTGDASDVVLNLMPTAQQRVTGSREIGVLKSGERKTIDIELTAHRAGRLQVRAMAKARGDLRDEASQDVVVRRANLELAVMGPPRNYAASTAVYKIRVENVGDAVADDAKAVATLPANASFVSGNDGATYDPERGQVTWMIGAMQPSAARVLEFECELHGAGENRMDVHCEADRDLSVAKSVVTHVEALADLKLYVNDPKGAVAVGESSVYEVRVQNRGTKAAESVQVVGYFSEGIEPTSVRGVRGEVATGQVVMDPIEKIAPGQEITFQIYAKAIRPGNHVFRAELQCNSPETRLAAEEWTKYYGNGEIMQASAPMDSSGEPTYQLRR